MSFLEPTDWANGAAEYRTLLLVTRGSASRIGKAVLDPRFIKAELARGGG